MWSVGPETLQALCQTVRPAERDTDLKRFLRRGSKPILIRAVIVCFPFWRPLSNITGSDPVVIMRDNNGRIPFNPSLPVF